MTALLDGADLRHVRIGDTELVQRVYMAVRDAQWNTIPAACSNWQVDVGPDRFHVAFDARHAHETIEFSWRGVIDGAPDGTIRYELDGSCHGIFRYCKIGFNVHHPLEGAIGRRYRASHSCVTAPCWRPARKSRWSPKAWRFATDPASISWSRT